MIFLKVTIMRVIVMKQKIYIYIKLCNSLDKTEIEETCIFNPSAFRQSNNKW